MLITQLWEDFRLFFEQQSGLAHFVEIAGAGIAVISVAIRLYQRHFAQLKYTNISSWVTNKCGEHAGELTKTMIEKLRIAIIDDEPADFPLEYIRILGYALDVFESFSIADVDKLNKYQLVILDIVNVVKEDPKRGGLELMVRIQNLEHRPLVIAVSGKRYDPTATEYFKVADKVMKKPVSQVELQEALENLLTRRWTPLGVAKDIDDLVKNQRFSDDVKRERVRDLVKALLGKITIVEAIEDFHDSSRVPLRKMMESLVQLLANHETHRNS